MYTKTIPDHHRKKFEYLSTYFRELRLNEGMSSDGTQPEHEFAQKHHRTSRKCGKPDLIKRFRTRRCSGYKPQRPFSGY